MSKPKPILKILKHIFLKNLINYAIIFFAAIFYFLISKYKSIFMKIDNLILTIIIFVILICIKVFFLAFVKSIDEIFTRCPSCDKLLLDGYPVKCPSCNYMFPKMFVRNRINSKVEFVLIIISLISVYFILGKVKEYFNIKDSFIFVGNEFADLLLNALSIVTMILVIYNLLRFICMIFMRILNGRDMD